MRELQTILNLPEAVQRVAKSVNADNPVPGCCVITLKDNLQYWEERYKQTIKSMALVALGGLFLTLILFIANMQIWSLVFLLVSVFFVGFFYLKNLMPLQDVLEEPQSHYMVANEFYLIEREKEGYRYFEMGDVFDPEVEVISHKGFILDIALHLKVKNEKISLFGLIKFGQMAGHRLRDYIAKQSPLTRERIAREMELDN